MKTFGSQLINVSGVLLFVSLLSSVPQVIYGSNNRSVAKDPAGNATVKTSMYRDESVDKSDDISINASLGDENITFERKKHRRQEHFLVVIQIIGVLVGKPTGE